MEYEIGSNNYAAVGAVDLSRYTLDEVLNFLSDCVCSGEVLLFFRLLDLPLIKRADFDDLGESFLYACTGGNRCHVLALLEKGMDPNYVSRSGETPVSSAAAWGNDSIVSLLFERGAIFRYSSINQNEELRLLLSNCAPETVMEVLSTSGFTSDRVVESSIAELASEIGRKDLVRLM
ncbi:ankyrin repeat domain-containing protein [Aliiroseovarius halocynthiae]|uniref:Uncharacterized protein n=1 Tax=Aliiroseovarius halocynthiae TaxID=985055 RepID=A0A545SLC8_9RHOB|nr:ankyrin repeat domain-containing protein [Aliiroseovarius halocynthiae]TQV65790.1 hypothetical protein FIL88_15950 [Aliiroseovarius halocynthiae]